MATGDHYATYVEVQQALNNANIGVAGGQLMSDTSIEIALDISQALINLKLEQEGVASITHVLGAIVCKGIQIDMIFMTILRNRQIKENNLSNAGEILAFFTKMLYFTLDHLSLLKTVNQLLGNKKTAFAYNINTGRRIV